jgi:hypothetical protein
LKNFRESISIRNLPPLSSLPSILSLNFETKTKNSEANVFNKPTNQETSTAAISNAETTFEAEKSPVNIEEKSPTNKEPGIQMETESTNPLYAPHMMNFFY